MNNFLNKYPYTNFHEMNLDWIINIIKQLNDTMDSFVNVNTIKYADPLLWNITSQYEQNTLVQDSEGNTYLSKKPVPTGISIENNEYWLKVADVSTGIDIVKRAITSIDEGTSPTATDNYSENQLLWHDNVLYKIITDITIGTAFVIGVNINPVTIEELINIIKSDLLQEINDRTNEGIILQNQINEIKMYNGYARIWIDSVNGDDNNTGTSISPFKTIDSALNKVLTSKPDYIEIILRDGSYSISRSILSIPRFIIASESNTYSPDITFTGSEFHYYGWSLFMNVTLHSNIVLHGLNDLINVLGDADIEIDGGCAYIDNITAHTIKVNNNTCVLKDINLTSNYSEPIYAFNSNIDFRNNLSFNTVGNVNKSMIIAHACKINFTDSVILNISTSIYYTGLWVEHCFISMTPTLYNQFKMIGVPSWNNSLVLTEPMLPDDFSTIYVDSNTGNDSNSGLYNYPVKTLDKAFDIAKKSKLSLITIQLATGNYTINRSVDATPRLIINGNNSNVTASANFHYFGDLFMDNTMLHGDIVFHGYTYLVNVSGDASITFEGCTGSIINSVMYRAMITNSNVIIQSVEFTADNIEPLVLTDSMIDFRNNLTFNVNGNTSKSMIISQGCFVNFWDSVNINITTAVYFTGLYANHSTIYMTEALYNQFKLIGSPYWNVSQIVIKGVTPEIEIGSVKYDIENNTIQYWNGSEWINTP